MHLHTIAEENEICVLRREGALGAIAADGEGRLFVRVREAGALASQRGVVQEAEALQLVAVGRDLQRWPRVDTQSEGHRVGMQSVPVQREQRGATGKSRFLPFFFFPFFFFRFLLRCLRFDDVCDLAQLAFNVRDRLASVGKIVEDILCL